MRIAIGADHAGYTLKEELIKILESLNCDIEDIGAYKLDPLDDYPDFAIKVANKVASGDCVKGIIICGSGLGASIAIFISSLFSIESNQSLLGFIYLPAILFLTLPSLIFVKLSANWLLKIPEQLINKLFSSLLIIIGLSMLFT